jgi:hypothetical protein
MPHWTQTANGKKRLREIRESRLAAKKIPVDLDKPDNVSKNLHTLEDAINFAKYQVSVWQSRVVGLEELQKVMNISKGRN